jgi:tetratricopeptide (TPR) repeat protein
MAFIRFVIAFLVLLPGLAAAATPSVQEVSQLFRQGKQVQALDKIDGFLAANPKDAQGRFLKGLILTELNRVPEAIKVFSDLADDYPELPEPYNNLAVLYAAQGQYDRARNSLEMAIRTHPSYATAHENLGDIYAKMASLAYDKALQLDQGNTSAQTKLALIKELFGPLPAPEPVKPKTAAKPAATKAAPAKPAVAPPATAPATESADPAKKPAAAVPSADSEAKQAVEQAIQAWAKAWSAKDVDAYLAAYAVGHTGGGLDRPAWEAQRRERLSKPAFIRVEVDKFDIELAGDKATASFRQRYESDRHRDQTRKILVLQSQDGAWKIVEER